jgi:hypothetical protein
MSWSEGEMFKLNHDHIEQDLYPVTYTMDQPFREMLDKSWAGLFYRKVFAQIDERKFEALYDPNLGRSNFPVNILAGLEIMKETFSLTDEQLFERYRFDLSFRYALGLEDINARQMSIRTLYNFRAAVAENHDGLFDTIFDAFRDLLIGEVGIKTGLQRTDSVMIGANIKRLNRVMLFHKVLSNLAKDVTEAGFAVSAKCEDFLKQNEDGFSYRLKKEDYVTKTVEIGEEIFRTVLDHAFHIKIRQKKSFKQALRLLKEQCRIEKEGKVSLKPSEEIKATSMQSPVDEDASYREKRGKKHVGYKVNAVETCDPDNPMQVVTSIETAANTADDGDLFRKQLPELKRVTDIDTAVFDGGYNSGALRKESAEQEIQLVMSAIRGVDLDAVKNKASLSEYINPETGVYGMCPAGIIANSISENKDGCVVLNFDAKRCAGCGKKDKCLALVGKKQSRLVIDDKRIWMDEFLNFVGTDKGKFLMGLRPAVEGLMSLLKPKYLSGRILFRGLVKVKIRMLLRGIGVNFKRYRGYLVEKMKVAAEMASNLAVFGFKGLKLGRQALFAQV